MNRCGPNGEQWALTITAYYCGNVGQEQLDANGDAHPLHVRFPPTDCDRTSSDGVTPCSVASPSRANWEATFQTGVLDGNAALLPDRRRDRGSRRSANVPGHRFRRPTRPKLSPRRPASRCTTSSFTSEVRYWFPFDSTKTYVLDFLGDDDVWMFVNRRLAVDLGGIHSPAQGTITLTGANGAAFGMTNGNVYEVEVFQAERQTTSSSFKLTLSGFNGALSRARPPAETG